MKKKRAKAYLWLLLAVGLTLPWISIHFCADSPSSVLLRAVLPGLAIFGAAFLLSWAAELAQLEISQALAFAFLALMAVLPEYAVDMYFAWVAAKDPTYTSYAMANMTGANRLLIGLGWPVVLWVYWIKSRKGFISLEAEHRVEIQALFWATLYSLLIPIKGVLSLWDAVVFISIFAFYIWKASQTRLKEPELEEGPAELMARLPVFIRRVVTVALFLWAGCVIYISAEPFAEGLLEAGKVLGVEEFLLVQWLAPLASESPEFIVALIFAWKAMPSSGFATLISSKVNQWTLLVGMLPLVFSFSLGHLGQMHLDPRQREELLLTSAQSLFALAVLADLQFSLSEAFLLFILFITQMFFPSTAVRYAYAALYLILTVFLLIFSRGKLKGLKELFSLRSSE
ncbi:MAG: sodium:calcium antiporter [Elusimicrobia bacterium]|nr:sodium:calcium antiporter [Elusimicrobiota bacterium]